MKKSQSLIIGASFEARTLKNQQFIYKLTSDQLNLKQALELPATELIKQKTEVAFYLPLYLDQLERLLNNPQIINTFSPEEKKAYAQDFRVAFFLLLAQMKIDRIEKRKYNLKTYQQNISDCARCIHLLEDENTILYLRRRAQEDEDNKRYENQLIQEIEASRDKPVRYVGLQFGLWLSQRVQEFEEGNTVVIRQWMDDTNDVRRHHWVWAGSICDSILTNFMVNSEVPQSRMNAVAPGFGYLSWIIYYARLAMNLGLLLKHCIQGPWMSKEEKELALSFWERFWMQWEQRGDIIINDFNWGGTNILCFYLLNLKIIQIALIGNPNAALILNLIVLIVDILLLCKNQSKEEARHNARLAAFENEYQLLNEKLNTLQEQIEKTKSLSADDPTKLAKLAKLTTKKAVLIYSINTFRERKNKYLLDWKYKRQNLKQDIIYSLALVIGFSMYVLAPLYSNLFSGLSVNIPPVYFGLVGATICFIFNIMMNWFSNSRELNKTQEVRLEATKLLELKELTKPEQLDDKKRLCLEIAQLKTTIKNQENTANYLAIKRLHALLKDILLPIIIYWSLVFMPLGIGIVVLASSLLVLAMSSRWVNQFKPNPIPVPQLEEKEFREFTHNSSLLESSIFKDTTNNEQKELKQESDLDLDRTLNNTGIKT